MVVHVDGGQTDMHSRMCREAGTALGSPQRTSQPGAPMYGHTRARAHPPHHHHLLLLHHLHLHLLSASNKQHHSRPCLHPVVVVPTAAIRQPPSPPPRAHPTHETRHPNPGMGRSGLLHRPGQLQAANQACRGGKMRGAIEWEPAGSRAGGRILGLLDQGMWVVRPGFWKSTYPFLFESGESPIARGGRGGRGTHVHVSQMCLIRQMKLTLPLSRRNSRSYSHPFPPPKHPTAPAVEMDAVVLSRSGGLREGFESLKFQSCLFFVRHTGKDSG